jgi:membrane fusion protein, multidrug efflux system
VSAEARSAQVNVSIVGANAFSQLRSAEAGKAQAAASVDTEKARLLAAQHKLQQDQAVAERTERDRIRYQALVDKEEISRSDYDGRATDAFAAQQAVEADRAAVTQRQAQIEAAETAPRQVTDAKAKSASAFGQAERANADLHTALLNLEYTKIYAPVSGVIGRKTVELGHRVQPGQGLMVIVPLDDIWVTANFKETQLKKMRPGQSVKLYVDTFGRSFKGTVESLPGAAGPLFSLFPPENSSGNYVKVVQRFPVRIRFDKNQDAEHSLRPGMSVEPTVAIR